MKSKILHFSISFVLGVVMSLILNNFGIGVSNFWWWAVVIWGIIGSAYNFWTRAIEGTRLPKLLGLLAGALIGIVINMTFFWYDASGMIK